MTTLGLDIGSSSVKAGILRGDRLVGRPTRVFFPTSYAGPRAEVDAAEILKAVRQAIESLGKAAQRADVVAIAAMAPSWVAMDAKGRALTPVVTHQDRRSLEQARQIEATVGKARHMELAGNRPFPGGISSTTWAWFLRHDRAAMKRAELVGHLSTLLVRQFTGARVTDPSNASFTGVYSTLDLSGWNDELCDAAGAKPSLLPDVVESNRIAGRVNRPGSRVSGLPVGMPIMAGLMDGSAGMLLAGAGVGQLFNVCGSTDVLALCTDRPSPDEHVLTRALGVGQRWLTVSTIAAAGSALHWAKEQLFADWTIGKFRGTLLRLSKAGGGSAVGASPTTRELPTFDPYLAGDRASIELRSGAFTGLTLSTTREQMLAAMIDALAAASAARLALLDRGLVKIRRTVVVSGGSADRLDAIFHRDWPGRWRFQSEVDATLRGLARLEPKER